jgi:MFS family permease
MRLRRAAERRAGGEAAEGAREGRADRALLLTVALGVFIAADDQTSIVTVLPAMVGDIGLTIDDFYRTSWIVNGYLLGYIVALPIVGRIADVYGHARVYAASLAFFMLGSLLVALAPTFEAAVAARAVQAVGGGAVVPVAMAIVVDELPRGRRLIGLGAIAAASEFGALVGPLWGGAITDWFGWRTVFWINLPMAAPVMYAAWRLAGHERRIGRIDWTGAAILGGALALLTFALVDDPNDPRPLAATLGMFGAVAVLGYVFWRYERELVEPMVRMDLFASTPILAANFANFLLGAGLITALIAVPLFVNLVLIEPPLEGGLTLMRLTVAVPLGALAGAWLASRLGLRLTAVVGMLIAAGGFAGLAAWDAELGQVLRTLPQLAAGLGFGLVIAPLSAAVLQRVGEAERATASAWHTLARVTGMLVGASLLTSSGLGRFYARAGTVPFGSEDFERLVAEAQVTTFREVFIAAALVMLAAAAVAWFVGRGEREASNEPWWTIT